MVTVIRSGASIRRTFLYNENKVKKGVAECIAAVNYPVDLEDTDATMRVNMLLRTASLHPGVKLKSTHISLNFAPGEKLSDALMTKIAGEYMEQIGFGDQPYLVYRHDDAAHPHIHIATTKIRPDGTRIDTQYIGKNKSEPARKTLELKYNLVRAEEQRGQVLSLVPVNAAKVIYGIAPTKSAIVTVLKNILPKYKYTSLHELNAVLRQYNVLADPGTEQSRTLKHHGLVYHVLDGNGMPVGVPIKASAMYNNPGLKYLEDRYTINKKEREPFKVRIKNAIDLTILRSPGITLERLAAMLKPEGIHVAIRQNSEGFIYGLTYVDHRTQCVFNGSAIGKEYSAKGMLEKLNGAVVKPAEMKQKNTSQPVSGEKSVPVSLAEHKTISSEGQDEKGLLEDLMQHEYSAQNVPFDWKRRKKKKKR